MMPNSFTRKRLVALIALIVVLGSVGFGFLWQRSQTFRLLSSTPKINSAIPTSTSVIKLTFSHSLDASVDYLGTTEGESVSSINSIQIDGPSIFIRLKPLTKNKWYSFTLKNIKAQDGRVIESLPIRFTAQYIPYNELPSDQKRLEVSQTDRETATDPILAYLPFQGDRIYITAEFTATEEDEEILVINAELFLQRSELGVNRSQAIQVYKDRVVGYISSKGLDPEKYLIRYEINEPPAAAN